MLDSERLDPSEIPADQPTRRRLAEQLEQRAAAAQSEGELLAAASCACDLLMLYPNERRYLDRFDEIVLSVDDPLSLLPVDGGEVRVATAAGRARALMMQRRLPDAVELLARAVAVAPAVPYLHWVARWLRPGIVESLPWPFVSSTLVRCGLEIAAGVPAPPLEDDLRVINLRAIVPVFAALRERHPERAILWFGEALIRRRLAVPEETLAVALEGVRRFPNDWRIRCVLLNAYRDAEQPDRALAEARRALAIDPSDLSPLSDAAWGFLDSVRNGEAAELFAELVQRQPGFPGARACMHYARWLSGRGAEDRDALIRLRERRGWDEQVRAFADEIDPPVPFDNVLPSPADPTGVVARRLADELGHVFRSVGIGEHTQLAMRARHLDSPSVSLAFDVAMRGLGARCTLNVEAAEIQRPDPRVDKAAVSTRIWHFDGERVRPAYPSGDVRAQAAIASIARRVFRREAWDAAAREVAASFGNEGYHALVSVLTFPPVPGADEEFDAFTWTWRCQVATAVVLSHLGPWDTGCARAALYSMVYGPSDWVTSAAIIAFAWRARESETVRGEVEPIFDWLSTVVPAYGFTAWESVLVECWRGLGGHSAERDRELRERVRLSSGAAHEKNPVSPPERRYGGLSLDGYASFCVERDLLLEAAGIDSTTASGPMPGAPSPELMALAAHRGVAMNIAPSGVGYQPVSREWEAALRNSPELEARFGERRRALALDLAGASGDLTATVDESVSLPPSDRGGAPGERRSAGPTPGSVSIAPRVPDPVVFPGQPVAKLSDYVAILRGMQRGDMAGALRAYDLDMMAYADLAQAWGAKLAADPGLTDQFNRMMAG